MIRLKTSGWMILTCKMHSSWLVSIGTPCLGSQGLGGGVVLAVDLVSHMFMYADISIVCSFTC